MKRTNKCELCGKRYRYPMALKVRGTLREDVCFTCEMATNLVKATEKVLEESYGGRYVNFLERLVSWRLEKTRDVLEEEFEVEVELPRW